MIVLNQKSPLESTAKRIEKELDCPLKFSANKLVFGEGNSKAKIFFIGEAPGFNEDIQGKPFVGESGKLLNKMLDKINISRDEIYITNILKFRPPNNRDPYFSEIKNHVPFLIEQIEIIQPNIIVPLGKFASQFVSASFNLELMEHMPSMKSLNGEERTINYNGIIYSLFPIFHPSYILRDLDSKLNLYSNAFNELRTIINTK